MSRVDLPPPLKRYLDRNVVQAPSRRPQGTRFEQRGEMRLDPSRPWLPFTADQAMEATHTEFHWHARVRMAPFVTAVVEDAFREGHGHLTAKVWGVVPVAQGEEGPMLDRGEAQRYLAELPWCPFAIERNPELRFEQRGPGEVRVWRGDPDTHVDLVFDEAGDIVGTSTTTRSRGDVVQPWKGRFEAYRDFGGIRAPSRAEVWWETPEGPYVYWRGEVLALLATDGQNQAD